MKALAAIWLAAALAGCSAETTLLVEVQFPASYSIDQLRFAGSSGDTILFDPEARPAVASGPLVSPQTLRVFLPGSLSGSAVEISVEGLAGGEVVALGIGKGWVQADAESHLPVVLGPGTCEATCDGCCQAGVCTKPSFAACGIGGVACQACEPARADHCDGSGACQCGSQPACAGPYRCESGECR